jgi:hypothetical protein
MPNIYQEIMGQELGDVFWALVCEVRSLSHLYDDSWHLFGDGSESRVLMLNKAAPAFFQRVQITFERELMLGICRITDPVRTGMKKNLTVLQLEQLLEQRPPESVKAVRVRAKAASDASTFARDWRNRWLAHKDLELSVEAPSARPLSAATLGKIDAALTAVDDVLKSVSSAFKRSDSGFRGNHGFGGSASLIQVIEEGLRARDQRTARIEAGSATEDDLAHFTKS